MSSKDRAKYFRGSPARESDRKRGASAGEREEKRARIPSEIARLQNSWGLLLYKRACRFYAPTMLLTRPSSLASHSPARALSSEIIARGEFIALAREPSSLTFSERVDRALAVSRLEALAGARYRSERLSLRLARLALS